MRQGTSNDQLAIILQGISDGVVYLDREARYLSLNDAAAEMFRRLGRDPEALIGQSVWAVFPELKATIVEKEIKRALEKGVRIEYEFLYPVDQHTYEVHGYPSPDA